MAGLVDRRRVILIPREHLAYGQDFQISGMAEHCGLVRLTKRDGKYNWHDSSDPELVVTLNPDDSADASFIAGLSENVPVVAHLHCRWEYFGEDQKKSIRRTLSNAAAAVVPAEFHKQEMKIRLPDLHDLPWHVAANGVRTDLFRPATQEERRKFKLLHLIEPQMKLVGFAGRIEPAKGTDVLRAISKRIADEPFALFIQFPAWQGIREKIKAWKFCMDFMQEIRAINRKIVVWADNTPRFNNRPIRFCDVLLSPSLSEVQPLVVLESLASGVPVVATDSTPFYAELRKMLPVLDSKCLQIVPLDDRFAQGDTKRESKLTEDEADTLAKKLIAKINDVDVYDFRQRESLSAAILEAGYSEASMNTKLASLYDDIVDRFDAKHIGVHPYKIHPLKHAYVDMAPNDIGVIEFIQNHEVVSIIAASNPDEGIRGRLNSALIRPALSIEGQSTHFRFEVNKEPVKRQLEMHRDLETARGQRQVE